MTILDKFSLKGKTAIVTGGEGMLGKMICQVIKELDGEAFSMDISGAPNIRFDITKDMLPEFIECDILVNNAIGNQKANTIPFQDMNRDIAIGLIGAARMTEMLLPGLLKRKGVILNIGSDLSSVGPDQTLYDNGKKKPASYSMVKHGIVGLTRWTAATYPEIRCNCLCPGGIDVGQKQPRTALNRLARLDELEGPVAFLLSEASSYVTGAILAVDGGRTCI